jgi:hypothetical protein
MDYYRLTIPIPKQPWRWIRFRIITILLLMTIVAIALAWRQDHERLAAELYRIQNPDVAWSVEQATGPPNTTGPGDIRTAWASASPDSQQEWLLLEYESAVTPIAIHVHETYNPGAVVKVTHVPHFGLERALWEGTDPTQPSAGTGMSVLPVTAGIKTGRIKIYIDSPAVAGWNEIDAVGLEYKVGSGTEIVWAKRAKASTSYGTAQSRVVNQGWSSPSPVVPAGGTMDSAVFPPYVR